MDISLEWIIVHGQRRFTSEYCMIEGEEETVTISKNQVTGSTMMGEVMAKDKHLWHLGMDRLS